MIDEYATACQHIMLSVEILIIAAKKETTLMEMNLRDIISLS